MGRGLLVALTLPGVVLLLVAVAVVEQLAARAGRRGLLTRTRRSRLSAAGLEVLSAALVPGREADLEQQRIRATVREDDGSAAPPRRWLDLDRGVACIDLGTGASRPVPEPDAGGNPGDTVPTHPVSTVVAPPEGGTR